MNLNMSTTEKNEFIYNWNIKNFQRLSTKFYTRSPSFGIECLKGIKLDIVLFQNLSHICFGISISGQITEPISIDYQYELTTSAGVILKTSDVLSHTFNDADFSYHSNLFKMGNRNMPEELCLQCRIISCKTPSMTSSSSSVVRWEAETDIVEAENSFEWPLIFSGCNQWTTVERVIVENIPIDVIFEYSGDALNIELFPKILDNKDHTVLCEMELMKEKQSVGYLFQVNEFNNKTGVYNFPISIKKEELEKVNCFITKKLNITGVFKYKYNSSITEIKDFESDSRTVNHAALTQNKEEADCISYLQQHFRNMLNEKTYSDVELRADNEVFFAHKCVLASRSPVFRIMFDQDMLESKTNVVHIHDVEAKTLKYFLEYIYTGTLNDLNDEIALKLLVVADKYQVPPLTERCSSFLKSVLSLDNVLNVLLVADLVNQEQLKLSSVEYIVENSTQVLSSPTGPQWMKENPILASEIFLKLSKKFDSISNYNKV